jgi:peptidoglycan hydrolase CwlO-like protein
MGLSTGAWIGILIGLVVAVTVFLTSHHRETIKWYINNMEDTTDSANMRVGKIELEMSEMQNKLDDAVERLKARRGGRANTV